MVKADAFRTYNYLDKCANLMTTTKNLGNVYQWYLFLIKKIPRIAENLQQNARGGFIRLTLGMRMISD